MATRTWKGQAVAIKHVATLAVTGTWVQGEQVTLTIDGLDVVVTIGTLVTTAQVATTIKQAFNGETLTDTSASVSPSQGIQEVPQFTEFVATVSSSTVTFTGVTAGKPVTMSAAENSSSGGITFTASATAATGPSHADNADNFSGAAVLADNDNFIVDANSVDILYGLSAACQPATVRITQANTGKVGLANVNEDGDSYPEYRTKYLTFDDNSVNCVYTIGEGLGQGSGRIRIDAGAGQATFNVVGRARRELAGVPQVLFVGTNTSNAFLVPNGDLGIAFFAGESANVASLTVGSEQGGDAEVFCGVGVTFNSGSVKVVSGKLTTHSAIATVNQYGGSWQHFAGTVTTCNVWKGTLALKNPAALTLTNLALGQGAILDLTESGATVTVTNEATLYSGCEIKDPYGRLAFGAGFRLEGAKLSDAKLNLGNDRVYTVT